MKRHIRRALKHAQGPFRAAARSMSRDKGLWSALFVILAAISLELAILGKSASSYDFSALAQEVVDRCAGASYRPTCYDEEIPKLMDKISMEDAFEVTRSVQEKDQVYQYCHVLGHKLSARETAKDPSRWQEIVPRCPSGLCSNGCIHGAFQERFRKETLDDAEIEKYKSQFANVCEPRDGFSPTGLEQGSCYHALGHLFMYIADADIDRSLALCRELTVKGVRDYSQLCFDGAFMQIFQPLEPDDFALIEGKEIERSEVKSFCDGYSGKEQGSCWSESWPLFREELSRPEYLASHCSYLPSLSEQGRCFNALMYVLTPQLNFDDQKIAEYCIAMPEEFRANCFAQAASRIIETDYRNSQRSAALCAKAEPYDDEHVCYRELLKYSSFNFHVGSEDWRSFCSALPEPWKGTCLGGGR